MPTPLCIEVIGPTAAHRGSGAVWQKDVKSPKGILSVWRLIGGERLIASRSCSMLRGSKRASSRLRAESSSVKPECVPSCCEGSRNGPIQYQIDPPLWRGFPRFSTLLF